MGLSRNVFVLYHHMHTSLDLRKCFCSPSTSSFEAGK